MNKKLIAVVAATTMAGAIGFASVAAAAEFNWYGSLRAGLVSGDDGKANRLDLGATGNDDSVGGQGLYSRIGIKAKSDLGNGSSAGLHLERGVGKDNLGTRHTNVWLGGGWGKLTFGKQGNPYHNARKWDQTWFLGGQFSHDGGSRTEGLQYSLAKGPFSFSVMAEANDAKDDESKAIAAIAAIPAVPAETTTIHYYTVLPPPGSHATALTAATQEDAPLSISGTTTSGVFAPSSTQPATPCTVANVNCALGYTLDEPATGNNTIGTTPLLPGPSSETRTRTDKAAVPAVAAVAAVDAKSNDGVDAWTITAGYDFGVVDLDVSHRSSQINNTGYDNTAIGVNGSVGAFGWYLAYQKAEDNSAAKNDVDSIGGFASFALSDNDKLYFYHVSHDYDAGNRPTESILGYSHSFGGGVSFIGEYLKLDNDTGVEPEVLALALKVDF